MFRTTDVLASDIAKPTSSSAVTTTSGPSSGNAKQSDSENLCCLFTYLGFWAAPYRAGLAQEGTSPSIADGAVPHDPSLLHLLAVLSVDLEVAEGATQSKLV